MTKGAAMPHLVDNLLEEAQQAIARMQAAAREARHLHARAELMRHLRTTALKTAARPLDEAVDLVTREWMQAWALDGGAYPELASEMRGFTKAICADARGAGSAGEMSVRAGLEALEAAFVRTGTTLSDQMAFCSECAHGWWEMVVPVPDVLRNDARRRRMPKPAENAPFWSAGSQASCG